MKKIFTIALLLLCLISPVQQVFAQDDGPGGAPPPAGAPPAVVPPAGAPAVTPPSGASTAPSIYGGTFANSEASTRYTKEGLAGTVLPAVASWIAGFLGAVAVLFLIWAGIQFLTAEGDPEKISKASKTAFYVLAGVLLVMFSYAIIYLFLNIFTP